MADLEALAADIKTIGEKIVALKAMTPVNKENIGAAVQELLEAKKLYAESNNGIGIDGKPFETLTKSEKKKKAKAEKGESGPAKPEADPDSLNAQKKAAKKAAKKAQKQVLKTGGAPSPATSCHAIGPPNAETTGALAKGPGTKSTVPNLPSALSQKGSLLPLQVVINPNLPLAERPVVAMAVAVLSNTVNDLDITSDHRSRHTAMGMEEGGAVTGDFAMARYLSRRSGDGMLLPSSPSGQALVDAWVDYAQSLTLLETSQKMIALSMTLHHALATSTYLVGHALSLADLAFFAVAGFPTQAKDLAAAKSQLPDHAVAASRWLSMMASHPALQEATQLCVGVTNSFEAVFDGEMEPLVSGMNALEGAVAGRVVTRFPPEPSGYLHIGHSKAALLNDYYARRYKGRVLLRFDDTNPSKEKAEFEESILVDLGKLEITPDSVSYTSDYFKPITEYAKILIGEGLAYMDNTPQEEMKTERAERQESKHRNQTPEEALKYFQEMSSGSEEGGAWCLRAKIDMQSDNGTMRDPVLFRQNTTPHHRSGTAYKAYPTYDLACPIVDSIEGVTHTLRTTEYNDRDEQYQWIVKALKMRRPRIHAFSRVNFVNTVLSKRKLTWFVENGHVTGWDDARFPTVRGIVRRGLNITALRSFMLSQGASRRVVNMDWANFWAENKKEIDKTAQRFMAIDKAQHTRLVVTNGPKEADFAFSETSCHPKDPSLGSRAMRLCDEVLLESVDVKDIQLGEDIVLLRWGVVKISKIGGDLEGKFIPNGDFKAAKKKLSWIANVSTSTPVVLYEFDNLVSKEKLEEDDNFEDYINPNTLAMTDVIGDAGLKTLQEHDVIQLERRGYYRVDRPYMGPEKPLVLYTIPDGKKKAMSGLSGKLDHR